MNIREYIKLSINDQLYGNQWKNPNFRNMYIKAFTSSSAKNELNELMSYNQVQPNISHNSIIGGSYSNNINADNITNDNSSTNTSERDLYNELGFTIKDTFVNVNTRSMLFGKHITPYYASIILEIAKYYNSQDVNGDREYKDAVTKYLRKIFKRSPNMTFNMLMKYFNAPTVESLLGYLLIAFQTSKLDLILRATYTFGRVLPLKCRTEWFDNYRLNAYGNVLNMVMYKQYDRKDVFTINESPQPINESVSLSFYPKIIKFLVGSLRAFMILNSLTVGSNQSSTQSQNGEQSNVQLYGGSKHNPTVKDEDNGEDNEDNNDLNLDELIDVNNLPDFIKNNSLNDYDVSIKENDFYSEEQTDGMSENDNVINILKGGKTLNNYSDREVTDRCYKQFPFYFGGAHGCDVFDYPNMSLSIDEITQFLNRYPSARVGYILNTSTYSSGHGQHWVALELTKGKARLICSQKGTFNGFNDGGNLVRQLESHHYQTEYNNRNIQTDNYACGTYAFISLMELLRFGDIKKAVDTIGVNMESLGKEIGKTSSADKVRENLVGWEK